MQPQNMSFYHLGIAPKMLEVLEKMKFVAPTPIQHQSIPPALEGQDIVGIAQTGTGKTMAFGIPIVQRLQNLPSKMALIMTPTRELALQVHEAMQKIATPFQLKCAVMIGGAPMHRQINALKRKPDIIIATPGRLIDHMEQRNVNLNNVSILVLDEADRMFDMGFAPQMAIILKQVPKERQTLLFSATMPMEVMSLASHQMKLPLHVEIAPSGTAAERVTQELFIVKDKNKKTLLKSLLNQYRGSVLIFTRTKIQARHVYRLARDFGHEAVEIHSDRTMGQRKNAIEGFKSGRHRVLVATDIAARGIDVTGIELVINYELPDDVENYVHRIGRTGRAGHEGHAVTFARPDQRDDVAKIEKMIQKTLPVGSHPEVETEEFIKPAKTFRRSFGSRGFRSKRRPRGRLR